MLFINTESGTVEKHKEHEALFRRGERAVCDLQTKGGSFGDVLKLMLRRWSGHPYCWMTALSAPAVAIAEAAVSLAHLLHVAQAVGSEDEVMRNFDSSDLLGVVLARDRLLVVFFEALLPVLHALTAALFRCGISVKGLADEAKAKFSDIDARQKRMSLEDMQFQHFIFVKAHVNRRIDNFCSWEDRQLRFIFRTLRIQGLALPAAAAALIVNYDVGLSIAVSDQESRPARSTRRYSCYALV